MRVTFLVTSLTVGGGAEQQVRSLAEGMKRRGHTIRVVSMLRVARPALPFVQALQAAGIAVDELGLARGRPDPRGVVRLARLLRRHRPDVVHAHMVHANLLARVTRIVAPTPVLVSTMHNQNEGGRWRYVAYRLTHRLSTVTTAVSADAAAEVVARGGAPKDGVLAVPNGLPTASFGADAGVRASVRSDLEVGDSFVWLAAGRLVEAKAYPDLLDAVADLVQDGLDIRVLVAGTGPREKDLMQRAAELRLGAHVDFLGFRSDLRQLMQAADAFVLSSRWEGLPMVLLEAAASGLPIVATDVAGSREAVDHGVTGFRVPIGEPPALAAAMRSLMDLSPAQLRAMSDAARRHAATTFDLERVLDRWEEIYRDALGERSSRSPE
jgi:glycosyltransferase involved in cell wall biosynthesis